MHKGRLEAFSDGVIAIIITIMVLELKVPHGDDFSVFVPLVPIFLSYILSFIYIGIYWNNHHHLLQIVERVNGGILWANLHLLFWLSLVPFATQFMGENHFGARSVAVYGIILLGCAVAYTILVRALVREHGPNSNLASALGTDTKGYLSLVLYLIAVVLAFSGVAQAYILYLVVALIWLVPDRRIEKPKKEISK